MSSDGQRWAGLAGILLVLAVAWLASENRRRVRRRTILWGLGLQALLVPLILGLPGLGIGGPFQGGYTYLGRGVSALIGFADEGAAFVFGGLVTQEPFLFAFRALPPIVFFSTLIAVLYHAGILQKFVRAIAWFMAKTMGSSGAESLATAANIFVGQAEAPLFVRPYLSAMTRSEIFCVMTAGMGTISIGVMGVYVSLLQSRIPDIAGHLLTANVMAAMASLMIAKILVPEKGVPETLSGVRVHDAPSDSNFLEAAARGATEGLHLALAVGAMLIAFIGLITLLDTALAAAAPAQGWSVSRFMGWGMGPVAWLLGVPWAEAPLVGQLLGKKLIFNEFVAYVDLAQVAPRLSDRSVLIAVYALCGFANFASVGIQIGALGSLVPGQRTRLSAIGLRALLGGTLVSLFTASIASLVLY